MPHRVRRVTFRSRRLGVGFVGAAGLAIAVVLVVNSTGSDERETGGGNGSAVDVPSIGENAAAHFEGGPDELLYLSGTSLRRLDVLSATGKEIAAVPSLDVFASPGSELIAYVASEDFRPVIHLLDARGREHTIGPGVSPLWMRTGARLAYLRPENPETCTVDGCPGRGEVVVLDSATEREDVLLTNGRWSLIAWAGDRLLVADLNDPSAALSVGIDGEKTALGVAVGEVWDASPDGKWLVTVDADGAGFVPLEDGIVAGQGRAIPLAGRTLADGTWSHDSTRVAAVVLRRGAGARTSASEVVVFSPADPEPRPLRESSDATGPVLWSSGNDAVAFSTVVDPGAGLLQTLYCPVDTRGQCRALISFTQDVVLLRTE